MKIGYIAPSLNTMGGWAYYAKGVVETLASDVQNDVVVLTGTDYEKGTLSGNRLTVYGVLPREVQFTVMHQLRVFYTVMRYLRGVDVIHACYERPMIGLAVAARVLNIPLVFTLHGTYAVPPSGNTPVERLKRLLMRFAYKTASITTTGSFNTENRVREIVSELPECRFIPNGVDKQTFYRKKDIVRGISILSVGALKPRKGFDVVIDALGILKNEFPDMKCTIVCGKSNDPTSEYYQFLQDKVLKNDLEARVLIKGNLTSDELADEYNRCGVFVLVSRDSDGHFEGFPMVYMEAFACGAPIVTTYGYGSEYAITPGKNGFLVKQEDPVATADAIRAIIGNPKLRSDMENEALNRAAEHTWDRLRPQLKKLYEDAKNIHDKKR